MVRYEITLTTHGIQTQRGNISPVIWVLEAFSVCNELEWKNQNSSVVRQLSYEICIPYFTDAVYRTFAIKYN